jgi:poly(3-hydroxybutyrate) depolymerase
MGARARLVRAIVVHGAADRTVNAVNGDQLVQQWLTMNHLAAPHDVPAPPNGPAEVVRGKAAGGYGYTVARWRTRGGRPLQEYVRVDGLDHAWSGGSRGAAFSDPRGPDASELIWAFLGSVATTAR